MLYLERACPFDPPSAIGTFIERLMAVSPEEFFMYLTIGLIVIAPIGARLYRRMSLRRTQRMLREQFNEPARGRGERQ